jgi:hypothetical protein
MNPIADQNVSNRQTHAILFENSRMPIYSEKVTEAEFTPKREANATSE